MKKTTDFSPPAIGGSSLLVIFAVLCLTVFALLSLSTVQAEKRLSDKAAAAVTDYFEADLEAQKVFARLRTGEALSGVREENGIYSFACPISENQTLLVQLQRDGDTWQVLRWQAVARTEEIVQTLPVWDGR